jgi:hypothetical protein
MSSAVGDRHDTFLDAPRWCLARAGVGPAAKPRGQARSQSDSSKRSCNRREGHCAEQRSDHDVGSWCFGASPEEPDSDSHSTCRRLHGTRPLQRPVRLLGTEPPRRRRLVTDVHAYSLPHGLGNCVARVQSGSWTPGKRQSRSEPEISCSQQSPRRWPTPDWISSKVTPPRPHTGCVASIPRYRLAGHTTPHRLISESCGSK